MQEEWIREEMMLGSEAVRRLQESHVIVFGIGGVGSFAAEALARAGIGAITLVDSDAVSVSNRNRQLIALSSTVGRMKSDVMAERVKDINPDCRVTSLPLLYTEETKAQFFYEGCHYDYIVDAIDLVSAKLSLIETALQLQIPIISCMGTGNKLHPELFQITDISKTSVCPLCRVMRKELRARGINHHTVLFSTEEAITPLELEAPPPGRRSVPASVSWVPSTAGLMLAGHVIMELAGSK